MILFNMVLPFPFTFHPSPPIARTSEPLHNDQVLNQMMTSKSNPGNNSASVSKNQVIITFAGCVEAGQGIEQSACCLACPLRHLISLTCLA